MFVLFTDIHWGVGADSDLYLQRAGAYIDWMLKNLPKRNDLKFVFLGDWFNDRTSISPKSQSISYDYLRRLAGVAPVYMIIGNHDCYFKDKTDISSIEIFDQIPNVHVVFDIIEIDEYGKDYALISWNKLDKFNERSKKYDAIFGHFEFVGAQLRGRVTTKGTDPASILKNTNLAFSGHYHIRKEYFFKEGKIQVVGSPFQINWGDEGDERGFVLFDTKTLEYTVVNNTVSPKHVYLRLSDLKSKRSDINVVKNNIPKLIVDETCSHETVIKLIDAINARQPFEPCEVEYSVSRTFEQFSDGENQAQSVSIPTYVNRYVEQAFEQQWPEVNDIDKDKLINLSMSVLGEDNADS